jgi:hypothetical protein
VRVDGAAPSAHEALFGASDVTARVKSQVRSAFKAVLTPSRDRMLIKITGWPRIGYLDEIFVHDTTRPEAGREAMVR